MDSVPICARIQCKYEPCELGKQLVLGEVECCPRCELPRRTCTYQGYLIQHGTEFSQTLCDTCKCKDGRMECANSCGVEEVDERLLEASTSLDQRHQRLRQHRNGHQVRDKPSADLDHGLFESKGACVHDNKMRPFNSTWSPHKCTQCRCEFNSRVDCFVRDCPAIYNCQNVRHLLSRLIKLL